MTALSRLFRLFAASVVPGGGFLLAGWSPATALTLYWIENVVGALAMSVRIALHRRWTGVAGHGRAQLGATFSASVNEAAPAPVAFKSFLAEFLLTSIAFSIAHGVFLAAVLGFIAERPELDAVRQGTIGIVIFHALGLSFDVRQLHDWPFARLKYQATQVMSRVVLVHFAILAGIFVVAWRATPGAFFTTFIWLKFLSDIGSMLPQWNPREPPRWLVRLMGLFPKQKGESFEAYWRRTRAEEEVLAEGDEQMTGSGETRLRAPLDRSRRRSRRR
jgi:hypothetical protein